MIKNEISCIKVSDKRNQEIKQFILAPMEVEILEEIETNSGKIDSKKTLMIRFKKVSLQLLFDFI